ncbi:MAG: hypothetical protein P1V97_04200 [Planctomycetota bacterium]|nr:hypothetical protein [Planctomycetota bacterium]
MRKIALTIALVISSISVVYGDPQKPSGPAKCLYLPGESEGDAKQALNALLASIERYPNSPTLTLALDRINRFESLVKDGRQQVSASLYKVFASKTLTNEWNRERLSEVVVDYKRADGKQKEALGIQRSRGYVRRWRGLGPFGYNYRAGLHSVRDVERDLNQESVDGRKSYRCRRQQKTWADLSKDQSPWSLNASLFSISEGGGTYYAVSELDSPKAQSGWLIMQSQSAKVWINRVVVGVIDRQRDRRARRLRFPIQLVKGKNRIVVKLPGGATSFRLRLAQSNGSAMTFKESTALDFAKAPLGSKPASIEPQVLENHKSFHRLAQWSTDMQVCYAYYLMSVQGLREEGLDELEKVLKSESAQQSPWILLMAGVAYESASHIGRNIRVPKARALIRKALQVSGRCQPATRRLAYFLSSENKVVESIALLNASLHGKVDDLETATELYRSYLSQNWLGEAADLLTKLISVHGKLPLLQNMRAAEYRGLGQDDRADKIEAALYSQDQRLTWQLGAKRRKAVLQGRFKEALKILAEEERLTPTNKVSHANAERLIYRAMGKTKEEIQVLRNLVEWIPESVVQLERLGLRLAELGTENDTKEALEILGRVLEKKPSRHDLRKLIAAIGEESENYWSAWDITAADLLKMKVNHKSFPKASSILLFDQEVTKIFADGSIDQVITQAWRILDDRGVESLGERPERGELMAIQTILPDGTVLEPIRTSGGNYQMPGLKVGAIVFHKYRSNRGAPGFQFSYGPWWFQDPNQAEPYALSRWILITPENTPFKIVERNMPVKATVQKGQGWITRIWETRMLDRVKPEPNMPSNDEILPHVRLYEPKTLTQVIPLYKDLPIGNSLVTPSIARAAKKATKGVKGTFEQALALFRFVKDEIKPGSGGSAAQILAAKRGRFLVIYRALLKAAKIPFDDAVAGLNPAVQVNVDWHAPSFGQFQTPLIRLSFGDRSIWVGNEGGRYMPFGALPERLWGASVLLLGPEGESLETLPDGGAERIGNVVALTIKMAANGAATLQRVTKVVNFSSLAVKEVVGTLSKAQLQNFLQRQANAQFPGAQVTAFEFQKTKVPEAPFTTAETIQVKNFARKRGDGQLILPMGLAPVSLSETFGGPPTRRFDIVLRNWLNFHDKIEIYPGKLSVSALPKSIFIKKQFASYSLTFRRKGEIIIIERHLVFPPGRIPVKKYGEFLRFLEAIDTAEQSYLVVENRP